MRGKLVGCIDEFRVSSLDERKEFYFKEFKIWEVKKFFRDNSIPLPKLCALDSGGDSGVIINKKLKGLMLYFPFEELKKQVRKYLPEDVYYDRNTYLDAEKELRKLKFRDWNSQELIFDVDTDNLDCKCKENKAGVCCKCLKKVFENSIKIKKELENKNFVKLKLVYSGRGFHVHVFDKKAYFLKKNERRKMSEKFIKYGIDEWTSNGDINLARMPFTLNSLVSRIATPVESRELREGFNMNAAVPHFLKSHARFGFLL